MSKIIHMNDRAETLIKINLELIEELEKPETEVEGCFGKCPLIALLKEEIQELRADKNCKTQAEIQMFIANGRNYLKQIRETHKTKKDGQEREKK